MLNLKFGDHKLTPLQKAIFIASLVTYCLAATAIIIYQWIYLHQLEQIIESFYK